MTPIDGVEYLAAEFARPVQRLTAPPESTPNTFGRLQSVSPGCKVALLSCVRAQLLGRTGTAHLMSMSKRPRRELPADIDRVLSTRELLDWLPLSYTTIWRMVRDQEFPPPLRLGRSRYGWRRSMVLAWLAERERLPIEIPNQFRR